MAKNMDQALTTFQMVLIMSGIGKMVTDMVKVHRIGIMERNSMKEVGKMVNRRG